MSLLTDFFDSIWQFFTVDLWVWAQDFLTWAWQTVKIFALEFGVVILNQLGSALSGLQTFSGDVFATFSGHYGNLPTNALAILTMLNVPAALGMLFAAYVTAFVLRIIINVVT